MVRGFSLGGLSDRCGVHKSTLSRWESGAQRPNIPELEATLSVLHTSPEMRLAILKRLGDAGAPRARRLLQDEQRTAAVSARLSPLLLRDGMPGSGSLLRALRLRRGWSQERLSSHLRRHQSAISLWERGDTWPRPDVLQEICALLGATAAETAALQTSHPGGTGALPEFGELEHQFHTQIVKASEASDLYPAMDLVFIALEAALWGHGLNQASVRSLLPRVYAHHANYLRNLGRFVEGGSFAEKALALREKSTISLSASEDWITLAVACRADAVAKGGNRPRPGRGEAILYRRLSQNQLSISHKAWLLRKISDYHYIQGRVGEAEESLLFSRELTQQTSAWQEDGIYSADHSQVEVQRYMASQLLQSGRSEESLRWLPQATDKNPLNRLRDYLLWAKASLQLSRRSEAQTWIERAYAEIERHHVPHRLVDFERLAVLL
jgi:transcriptional regulator with XRE-family HTH domain